MTRNTKEHLALLLVAAVAGIGIWHWSSVWTQRAVSKAVDEAVQKAMAEMAARFYEISREEGEYVKTGRARDEAIEARLDAIEQTNN